MLIPTLRIHDGQNGGMNQKLKQIQNAQIDLTAVALAIMYVILATWYVLAPNRL